MITLTRTKSYPSDWRWRFALLPTVVGTDKDGNEIRVWFKWYQSRIAENWYFVERKFGDYNYHEVYAGE